MSDEDRKKWRRWGKIGRAVQRLDGFCSADVAYQGGWLETPTIIFEGIRLMLNIDTSAVGTARAAITKPDGTPLSGFNIEDCDEIMTNNVNHLVTWRGNPDISALAGQHIRLRFEMRSAKLYAFQFENSP